jgi:putative ABC transport system permease protein
MALTDPMAAPDVLTVAPVYQGSVNASYGSQNTGTSAQGITPEYMGVRNFQVSVGRSVTQDDIDAMARVAVLGDTVAQTLFPGDAYPIGETIRLNNVAFDVIGVLAQKGGSGMGNADDTILIPLSTAQTRLFKAPTVRGDYAVSQIAVQARSKEASDAAMAEIQNILRERHRIGPADPDDFNVMNQADLLATMANVTGTMTLFLGSIAAISLVVGGIGIMNIMLVSVTERTREIGLRKAVGAARKDILLQFLIEAVTLSLIGGFLGVALGSTASRFAGSALNVPTTVTPQSVTLAVGFSAVVGIVFGIYPAMRAARLHPIEALRYE